jgi:hypothetical protein
MTKQQRLVVTLKIFREKLTLSFILRPAQLPERSGMIQAKGQVL